MALGLEVALRIRVSGGITGGSGQDTKQVGQIWSHDNTYLTSIETGVSKDSLVDGSMMDSDGFVLAEVLWSCGGGCRLYNASEINPGSTSCCPPFFGNGSTDKRS